jgi:hypothetical protein
MKISIEGAAKRMGVSPMFLRLALRRGELPFGTAVKFDKQWRYYINPIRFEKWMTGEDLAQRSPQPTEKKEGEE